MKRVSPLIVLLTLLQSSCGPRVIDLPPVVATDKAQTDRPPIVKPADPPAARPVAVDAPPAKPPFINSSAFSRATQEAVYDATVRIKNEKSAGEGSGVIVKQDRVFIYILTAAHIVDGTDQVLVSTFSAADHPLVAKKWAGVEVLARMPNEDLAVLRAVDNNPVAVVPICAKKNWPKDGVFEFEVLTSGCTLIQAPELMTEKVRAKRLNTKKDNTKGWYWETYQLPDTGRSGGPMVDKEGRVLGICSGIGRGATQDRSYGYYSHIEAIHAALGKQGLKHLLD